MSWVNVLWTGFDRLPAYTETLLNSNEPGFKANPSPNYKPQVCGSKYVSEMVLNHLVSKAEVQQENRKHYNIPIMFSSGFSKPHMRTPGKERLGSDEPRSLKLI